jgi:transcriptional regulator with XRE-family HTH domain
METIDLKDVGKRIKSLRKVQGKKIKQKDLAAQLGIEPSTLSKYESGKLVPSLEFLVALTFEKQISFHWLMLGREHSSGEESCWIIKEPQMDYGEGRDAARKLLDNIIRILESKNKTVIKALAATVEGLLIAAIGAREPEMKEGG